MTVIHLRERRPEQALEQLGRVTGLHFAEWPQSLLEGRVANLSVEEEEAALRADERPETSTADLRPAALRLTR